MEELIETTSQIKNDLSQSDKGKISERHFHSQMMNFVVGNAFDVFQEANTVTQKTVKQSEKSRLLIVP